MKPCINCSTLRKSSRPRCNSCANENKRKTKIGSRFGKLEVIQYLKLKHVLCKCDCGKQISCRTDYLKKAQRHCGCDLVTLKGQQKPNYKKELHHPIFADRIDRWKRGAARRSYLFELTEADLERLWTKQQGRCFYTGNKLSLIKNDPYTISLERMDSNKPYTIENCVFIGTIVNRIKMQYSKEVFFNVCRDVVKYNSINESAEDFNESF